MNVLARRLPFQSDRRAWFRLAALLIALIAALPLLESGALLNTRGGGDSPFLLQRVQQLVISLQDGHFPARWMPDAAYGYGYPFFHYYAPLSLYVAALFRFLGAPFTTAIQLAQLSAFLLAAWATLELARRWLGNDWAALLASAAYTLAPFHLLNVYVRGDSLAEFWAMALYPLVLLAADRLLLSRRHAGDAPTPVADTAVRVVHLALAYAALVLSHNISALIFSPFLLLYILLVAPRVPRRALGRTAGALLLALLLSAWFWLPALGETALAQTATVTAGYFHYSNHFRGADLVQPTLFFDWQVAGQTAFRMGLVQVLLIAAGLLALAWRLWHDRRAAAGASPLHLAFATAMLLGATFMITPLSRPLWTSLPLLPYTQFPWRFLSVQALAGALLSGGLGLLPVRRLWSIGGIVLLLAVMLPTLQVDHLPLADEDVTALRLAQYEWFTGNIGTTVSAEYLPRSVQPRPYTSAWLNYGERNAVQALAGEASARLVERSAASQVWQVQVLDTPAHLEFPTLYWPGWQARVGAAPVAISAAPGSGLIAVELPPGEHTLHLRLGRTSLRLAAELLSFAALLALLFWAARRGLPRAGALWRQRPAVLVVLALALLLALFWRLRPEPVYEQRTLSWDFAQMGYLHHAPDGIPFSDGARLLRYDYSATTAVAGETLRVEMEWRQGATQAPVTLALVTPAVHRSASAPPLVSAAQPLRDGRVIFELPVPANAPPGLYVPRLTRQEATALTPSGTARGALFLHPLHIVTAREGALPALTLDARLDDVALPSALPRIDDSAGGLFDCAAGGPSPGALELHLAWFTAQPLAQNFTASLRLNGADGSRLAQCDMQPGYGFLPSGGWTPQAWTPDRLALPLPPALPPDGPYVLLATLYDANGATVLIRRLGELHAQNGAVRFMLHEPQFTLPPGIVPLDARFGESIALRGYTLQQQDQRLQLVLYWQALAAPEVDYTRFVHLLAEDSGAPLAQQDGAPQNGAYPTAQWTAGEVVVDAVTLDTTGLDGGAWRLAVGFYDPQDPAARLPVFDGEERELPGGRLLINPQP